MQLQEIQRTVDVLKKRHHVYPFVLSSITTVLILTVQWLFIIIGVQFDLENIYESGSETKK